MTHQRTSCRLARDIPYLVQAQPYRSLTAHHRLLRRILKIRQLHAKVIRCRSKLAFPDPIRIPFVGVHLPNKGSLKTRTTRDIHHKTPVSLTRINSDTSRSSHNCNIRTRTISETDNLPAATRIYCRVQHGSQYLGPDPRYKRLLRR